MIGMEVGDEGSRKVLHHNSCGARLATKAGAAINDVRHAVYDDRSRRPQMSRVRVGSASAQEDQFGYLAGLERHIGWSRLLPGVRGIGCWGVGLLGIGWGAGLWRRSKDPWFVSVCNTIWPRALDR